MREGRGSHTARKRGKFHSRLEKRVRGFSFFLFPFFPEIWSTVSPPHKCRCPKEARVEGGDSRSFLRPENGRRRRRIRRKGRRGGGGRKEGGKEADARGLIKRPLFSSEVRTFSLVVVLVSREGKGSSSLPLSQTGATFPVLPSF